MTPEQLRDDQGLRLMFEDFNIFESLEFQPRGDHGQ